MTMRDWIQQREKNHAYERLRKVVENFSTSEGTVAWGLVKGTSTYFDLTTENGLSDETLREWASDFVNEIIDW